MASQTDKVDAASYGRSGTAVERRFAAGELPRVAEAGAAPGSVVTVHFQFSEYEGRPTVTGTLRGTAVLECQRCLGRVAVPLDSRFGVVLVAEASELAGEPGGYEPILAEANRLDLRWLAEEETLLALPLVALHEPGECQEAGEQPPQAGDEHDERTAQRPFANLRDILQKR